MICQFVALDAGILVLPWSDPVIMSPVAGDIIIMYYLFQFTLLLPLCSQISSLKKKISDEV